jgi:hypothetical protein
VVGKVSRMVNTMQKMCTLGCNCSNDIC